MKHCSQLYIKVGLSLLMGLAVFLFWGWGYPHALSYQEQYQLFLWSGDYLRDALRIPGGMAAWLGEWLVQFYYVEWLGALLLALLFVGLQQLSAALLRLKGKGWYAWSFFPPVLLLWLLGDESVLMAYVVALLLSTALFLLLRRAPALADVIVIPIAYWLFGPMAWLYVALRVADGGWRRWWMPLLLLAMQGVAYGWLLPEWQLYSVLTGWVYYRIPLHGHALMWVIPLVMVAMMLLSRLSHQKWMWPVEAGMLVALAFLSVNEGYEREKYELIRQDYLVRHERWSEIIDRAEKYQVQTPFSSVCVNLALAEKRQLADRMFDFYQSGPDALVMGRIRDLTSMLPSAEVFWRLGMVNSAQRYMFDTQESILNAKRSGRCTQRIAECMIVNGHYQTARKQLDLLSKTLFYRGWAKEAKACLGDEAKINAHPVWGRQRQLRYKSDFLFSYGEMDKMLGQLFIGNTDNKMALDYMLAQMLLNGNVQAFSQYLPWAQRYGGYSAMPLGYQDVVRCIQSNGKADGSPYMDYIKRLQRTQP